MKKYIKPEAQVNRAQLRANLLAGSSQSSIDCPCHHGGYHGGGHHGGGYGWGHHGGHGGRGWF